MLTCSRRTQIVIGVALATLMAATRGRHFGTVEQLPSASWAMFFLAGVYVRPLWVFPALLGEAAALDFAAITWGGVSSFCVSPAYGFLIPAYGSLWICGRWYATRHEEKVTTLLPLAASVVAGTIVCELLSSGSFYFLSGGFEQTSLTQFASRFAEFFPRSFSSLLWYVGIAGLLHLLCKAANPLAPSFSRFRTSS